MTFTNIDEINRLRLFKTQRWSILYLRELQTLSVKRHMYVFDCQLYNVSS
jgi:hypothetical protein